LLVLACTAAVVAGCASAPESGKRAGTVQIDYAQSPQYSVPQVTWVFALHGQGIPNETIAVNISVYFCNNCNAPQGAAQTDRASLLMSNGSDGEVTLHSKFFGIGDYWIWVQAHDPAGALVGEFFDIWSFCLC
jgi:hypothetical protein